MRVTETAPAKVNLYLHVVGRRDDGYHLLDSLAVFPEIGDELRAELPRDDRLTLSVDGPFGPMLAGEADNLTLRAARQLAAATDVPARALLTLTKRLPVASGIGGGSADAAATLRILASLWNVPIPPDLPLRLGADVPVCLASQPARMSGVGEHLSPVPKLPPCGIVLVNPGLAVATSDVFRGRSGAFSAPAEPYSRWQNAAALAGWLSSLRNDLELSATALCPAIAEVLARLRGVPGCLLARMSGSGATCFGLFADPAGAERAASDLRRDGWWTWGGAIACPVMTTQIPAGVANRA